MTEQEFYGDTLAALQQIERQLAAFARQAQQQNAAHGDRSPIEHYKTRIKTADSMLEKLQRRGFACSLPAALRENHDAVGLRIVCTFLSSVYAVAQQLRDRFDVIEEKDYIRAPKENGYRSLHLILRFPAGEQGEIHAEVQLRTIAMDCWASLEHQLKYKHHIPHQQLIVAELKRCACELAGADLTMQTIEELLQETEGEEPL